MQDLDVNVTAALTETVYKGVWLMATLVNMVMKLVALYKKENFMISWSTVSFSTRNLLYKIST